MALAAGIAVRPGTTAASEAGSTVLAWGSNFSGQVGDGTAVDRLAPVELPGLDDISAVAAADRHSLALRGDGRVLAWGSNSNGQLGDPSTVGQVVRIPTLVPGLTDVVAIEAYALTSLAVDARGTVWEWGQAIEPGGTPAGPLMSSPTPVSGLAATAIAAGLGHRLAISYGVVRPWGENTWGGQGDGTTWPEWRPTAGRMLDQALGVAGGVGHTVVLRDDGTVWTVGRNDTGQLGDGTLLERHSPAQIGGISDVDAVDAADRNSMALRADGTLWSWGDRLGALGYQVTGNVLTPRRIAALSGVTGFDLGGLSAAALTTDGVWSWGISTGNPDFPWYPEPLLLPGTADATDVARGTQHGLVVLNGVPDPPPPVLPPAATTTLTVDGPASAELDELVAFTATISPNPGGGTVTLSTSGVVITTAAVDPVSGTATLWASFAEERSFTLLAEFAAVPGFEGSSAMFELKVGRTPTTTTVVTSSPPNPVPKDFPVTVTVRVDPTPDLPAELDLFVDSRWITRVVLESSEAEIVLDPLPPGTHTVIAHFVGSENYAYSYSEPYSIVVAGIVTTTSLTVTPADRALAGTPVRFEVAVEPAIAPGVVEIVEGELVIGTIDLAQQNDFTTDALSIGTHLIRARFLPGAAEFDPSESEPLSYEIYADVTPPTGSLAIDDVAGYSGDLTVQLTFAASDEGGSGVAWVEVSSDGATWERRSWPLTEPWSWTLSADASAPDGPYTIQARFVDAVGNVSAVVSDTTYLDRTPPTLSGRPTASVSEGGQVTTTGAIPVTVQWPAATDAGSGVAVYEVERSIDGGPWTDWMLIAPTGSGPQAANDLVGAASTRYRVTAFDVFGRGSATITGTRLNLARYDESSTDVSTTGRWQSNTTADAWGGTTRSTSDTGATMRLRFTGRAIYWVAPVGGMRGLADIYIDGRWVGSVDLGQGEAARRIVFGHLFSETGEHMIKIRCVGTSDRPLIESDGFIAARW